MENFEPLFKQLGVKGTCGGRLCHIELRGRFDGSSYNRLSMPLILNLEVFTNRNLALQSRSR